ETCSNGSSEFVSNVSSSIVGILFNYRLLALAGESGVSAYGVLMYVNFIYVAILLGYSIGVAPVIGYHYGAKNHGELKSLFKKSLVLTGVTDLILTALAEILAAPLSYLFVGKNPELYSLTRNAFYLYSLCFLFTGFNIFGSAFFTALSNGKVSAAISFLRTVVFQVAAVLTLPELMHGINGVWLSVVVAEILSFLVTVVCFIRYRKRYGYA
ncbi:MAG TPA: MATE family efflux transporter, partial [Clostridiales bacterium]|nr:MATE family efflux transporter [Clostridiales bacterium]